MSEELSAPGESAVNHGWRVTFAGLGINLALGILYTWSVISKGIPEEWGWNESDKSWPYSVACLVFCLIMLVVLGIAFLVVVVGLAQILKPPAKGYVPAGTPQVSQAAARA